MAVSGTRRVFHNSGESPLLQARIKDLPLGSLLAHTAAPHLPPCGASRLSPGRVDLSLRSRPEGRCLYYLHVPVSTSNSSSMLMLTNERLSHVSRGHRGQISSSALRQLPLQLNHNAELHSVAIFFLFNTRVYRGQLSAQLTARENQQAKARKSKVKATCLPSVSLRTEQLSMKTL